VVEVVEKQQVLTPEQLATFNASGGNDDPPMWVLLPFFGLFVTIGCVMLGAGVRTRTIFPIVFGGFFGAVPLLMSLAVSGLWPAAVTLVPWALGMFVVGYWMGARQSWRDAFRNQDKGGGSSSGWTMGSTSSSGGSRSGSSGSSSSFGGGSSGGGGASGRW